jgi:transposase-like protein
MKFCPNCGSTNIGWLIPYDRQKWHCKNCGYIGAFIVEDGKIADKIREEFNKKENIDK